MLARFLSGVESILRGGGAMPGMTFGGFMSFQCQGCDFLAVPDPMQLLTSLPPNPRV